MQIWIDVYDLDIFLCRIVFDNRQEKFIVVDKYDRLLWDCRGYREQARPMRVCTQETTIVKKDEVYIINDEPYVYRVRESILMKITEDYQRIPPMKVVEILGGIPTWYWHYVYADGYMIAKKKTHGSWEYTRRAVPLLPNLFNLRKYLHYDRLLRTRGYDIKSI